MDFILFDGLEWNTLLPITFTRSISDIRIGITTLKDKWKYFLGKDVNIITKYFLKEKYSSIPIQKTSFIVINSSFIPNKDLIKKISNLNLGEALVNNENIIIAFFIFHKKKYNKPIKKIKYSKKLIHIKYPWDIFLNNSIVLRDDFNILTKNKKSFLPEKYKKYIVDNNIFFEKGAIVNDGSVFNTDNGPIYIGKNSIIMEGCFIRGGLALCEGATLKMGSKIYGNTTIGPYCKVGGEVENSIFLSYSNKSHDGFLGNSIISEWCNLGAGTNVSNLKNNYSKIRVWSYLYNKNIDINLQFCGIIMGDHSKSSINTQFNTSTVIGVSSNIFGYGLTSKHIPSFTWGGVQSREIYNFEKACQAIENIMLRRQKIFNEIDRKILKFIFDNFK